MLSSCVYWRRRFVFDNLLQNLSRGERQGVLDLLLGAIGGEIEQGSP